jgi:hypothetical protein
MSAQLQVGLAVYKECKRNYGSQFFTIEGWVPASPHNISENTHRVVLRTFSGNYSTTTTINKLIVPHGQYHFTKPQLELLSITNNTKEN